MIKVEELSKKYGDFIALGGVTFELKEGEVVGLLGPNGAGKTTLLRILVSYLEPSGGRVQIDGLDAGRPVLRRKIKSRIGYLPEQAPLYEDMLVSEYLEFIGRMQGLSEDELDGKVDSVIKKCGLLEKEDAQIATLSKGYRQRVGIAQALIHDPKIVILDEPTTGLDPNQRIEIRDLILEIGRDRTVILSSHILSEVQSTCSRVIILSRGLVVADGTPAELENKSRGNSTVRLEVEKDVPGLLTRLKELPGVLEAVADGTRLELEVEKGSDVRSSAARVAVESGAGLLGLERKQTSLEDVFIELTKKENE